jgi:hypothetical protein
MILPVAKTKDGSDSIVFHSGLIVVPSDDPDVPFADLSNAM